MTTIATCGGGTAGHVLPCIALLPHLKKHFDRVIHLGVNGMEKHLMPKHGIPFFETNSIKFDRSNLIKNLKIPFVLSAASKQAKQILACENVDVLFSKGGYASLPAVLGAKSLEIPIIIHESDYQMGLANKMASFFADLVLTSFPETKNGIYVGNPIREEIFQGNPWYPLQKYELNPHKQTILVFGGSSGARVINDVIFKIAHKLTSKYNVIHLIGDKEKRRLFTHDYVAIPYADNIADLYALADLVIMRGGANSLQEATMLGKRVICIPLPKSKYSRGDQVANAISYQRRGLINILPQDHLTEDSLINEIATVISQKEHPICKDTPNEKIVEQILTMLKN